MWDGDGSIDLGVYDTDRDARQAAGTALRLCMFHKHKHSGLCLLGGAGATQGKGPADQAALPGLLPLPDGSNGAVASTAEEEEAAAAASTGGWDREAAAAAAAAASTNSLGGQSTLQQLIGEGDQAQYSELVKWLAQYDHLQIGAAAPGPAADAQPDAPHASAEEDACHEGGAAADAHGCSSARSARGEEGEEQPGPPSKRARGGVEGDWSNWCGEDEGRHQEQGSSQTHEPRHHQVR